MYALGWSLQRQTSVCEGLLLYLQREVWHSRAPLSAFLGWRRFSIKSRLSMQGSQEKGRGWSAARPLKRRVRLGDLRHFHTLFAGRSYLELCSALSHFICFFWLSKSTAIRARPSAERSVSLHPPKQNWHFLRTQTWSLSDCDRNTASARQHALRLQYFATTRKK